MKAVELTRLALSLLLVLSFCCVQGKEESIPTVTKKDRYQDLLETARSASKNNDVRKAVIHYQKLIGLSPTNLDAWTELGALRYEQGDYKEALYCYRKALAINPDSSSLHHNIGLCLKKQDNVDEAKKSFEQALKLQPNSVRSYLNYALLLKKQDRFDEAIEVLNKGIAAVSDDADMHRVLGMIYREQSKFDLAIEQFRHAVKISPDNATMLTELANSLCMVEQLDEALELYRQAFEVDSSLNNVLYNIGYVLKRKGYLNQSIEVLNKVIEREPDNGQAHFSLGLTYLMRGATDDDWINGWLEYEWRWAAYQETKPQYHNKPFWQGEDITGKTILLIGEQGLGDTFQFIRYAKLLKERGAHVIFLSQKPLKTFLKGACDYLDDVVATGDPLPYFDYQLSLMSLPLLFSSTEKTLPAEIPYLKADADLIEYWHERLASDKKIKIGLCWQGNANYRSQALQQVVAAKSFEIKQLATLASVDGCSFYSLQKINGTNQLNDVADEIVIVDFGAELDEAHGRFMDTAAIIMNLDVVITADTSIAHLAAALGVRTWVLLPTPSDWRWMAKREDTPWYPNIRLFRQPTSGNWDGAIQTVVDALQELVNQKKVLRSRVLETDEQLTLPAYETAMNSAETQNVGQEATEILSLPVADFLDRMTVLALQEDKSTAMATISENDRAELLRRYQAYGEQYPQIKSLTQGLYAANCYLVEALNALNGAGNAVAQEEVEAKMKRLHDAQKLKKRIKDEISTLVK